jgi:hypothetical protein
MNALTNRRAAASIFFSGAALDWSQRLILHSGTVVLSGAGQMLTAERLTNCRQRQRS